MLALGLTVGLAALSWRYFEKRFVALGHSFRYERRGADSPAVRSLDSVPLENERLTGAVL
jgi:peptidoglycan/LPS O-acetylase OafA/YrhL